MKKFLLSLGLLTAVLGANATVYTVYDKENKGTAWATEGTGFTNTVTVDGKSFTLSSDQASSTNKLMNPGTSDQWRIYKGSQITISSADVVLKGIRLTIDGAKYAEEGTLSSGWTGKIADLVYTLESAAGSKELTLSADNAQIRVSKVEVSDEAFSDETPDTPVTPPVTPAETVVKSIKEAIALASDTPVTVDFDLTVAFVNINNIYVTDAAGDFIQIYGKNSYEVNDIIPAGWKATYKLYNDVTPEFVDAPSLPDASGKGNFVPAIVGAKEISNSLVNNVIAIKDVELSEATPAAKENFTGISDDVTLNFRNNYQVPSVEAGKYNMTVLVTIYQGEPSLYVINYDANISSTVLNTFDTNSSAPEYFTLQGVKVATPENGLYIRVQGGKATKVLVK